MISVREPTAHHRATTAVEPLGLELPLGRVTGFLGPNGAGTSAPLRRLVGLDAPDSGRTLTRGRRYAPVRRLLQEVARCSMPGASRPGAVPSRTSLGVSGRMPVRRDV
ncbi:Sulfate/thiosulfate import ATP-binding protein CysA [Streptomyces sp. YIM 130001]|uniref:ATP-binding cassette domain-containing protein n=1 Tax=Streptomyces sp. YIM 130001 TaxID=2259644 RepID=UPI000EBFE271|nr:Sulfate/thiosulfate import ATP-binding protein CysA [Streptomyces sp. YIM 130001]